MKRNVCIFMALIMMLLTGCEVSEDKKQGTIAENIYENQNLGFGFELPDGYEFYLNIDDINETAKKEYSVVHQILNVLPSIEVAVKRSDMDDNFYSMYVLHGDRESKRMNEYDTLEFTKESLKSLCLEREAYDIHVSEETVSFCGKKMTCAGVSFVIDEKPGYMYMFFKSIEDKGTLQVWVYGDSKEEAELLLNNFYKIN